MTTRLQNRLPNLLPAALLAASLAAVPAVAGADEPHLFKTTLVSVYHPAGVYEGTLSITFARDGTIFGFYRPVDSGQSKQVSGGLTGDHIHLDIDGYLPIQGTYDDGTIVGYTFVDRDTDKFTATPTNEPNS